MDISVFPLVGRDFCLSARLSHEDVLWLASLGVSLELSAYPGLDEDEDKDDT